MAMGITAAGKVTITAPRTALTMVTVPPMVMDPFTAMAVVTTGALTRRGLCPLVTLAAEPITEAVPLTTVAVAALVATMVALAALVATTAAAAAALVATTVEGAALVVAEEEEEDSAGTVAEATGNHLRGCLKTVAAEVRRRIWRAK